MKSSKHDHQFGYEMWSLGVFFLKWHTPIHPKNWAVRPLVDTFGYSTQTIRQLHTLLGPFKQSLLFPDIVCGGSKRRRRYTLFQNGRHFSIACKLALVASFVS